MRRLYITFTFFLISFTLAGQKLDKLRALCIDEVNFSHYNGNLSQEELKKQISALGFQYIENGEIKYHKELVVYDCNTGIVKFTAVFDKNRLENEFVLYESEDVPSKKILFSKKNSSSYVDLKLNFRGQQIPAYPVGKAEIFEGGKLKQTILFSDQGALPKVINYDLNLKKTSEGNARISGNIQEHWNVAKTGEWKYFDNGQLVSVIRYGNNGEEVAKKTYTGGKLTEQVEYLANGAERVTAYYDNGNVNETGVKKGSKKTDTWKYYSPSGLLKKQVEYLKGEENVILIFDEQGNIVKRSELVWDKSELNKSLQNLSSVYRAQAFYPDEDLKSDGFEYMGNKVGVFEFYDENTNLSEIREYDLKGNQINSVDAQTYKATKQKEREIFRELLVPQTTNPLNIRYLTNIERLTDSLEIDFDSLMMGYEYKEDYQKRYAAIVEQTTSFGKLSNKLIWYDSLLSEAEDFNDEIWAYSQELLEMELALEKRHALSVIEENLSELTAKYTSSKKTIFGKKTVVLNEQDQVYELVTMEMYPNIRTEISNAGSKSDVHATVKDFKNLLKRASDLIQNPDEKFQQLLDNSKSVEDRKQLFLTAR